MLKRLFRAAAILVVLGVLAAGAAAWWGYDRFTGPGPLAEETVVLIPRGAGLAQIAGLLRDAGVIEDALVFRLGVRALGQPRALRAGEFAFPAHVSAREAMDIIVSGEMVQHRITVAEGLTTHEVLQLVRKAEKLRGEITRAPGEGDLLPDTYNFALGDTRDAVVARMEAAMDATVAELWGDRAEDLPYDTPEEAVILASIVEKETGVPEERARIAGVFVNRLRMGMALQSDPTVIYGITGGEGELGRALLYKDLETPTPYNTYVHPGLPPGPIANPGRAALEAAMNPLDTNDIYFVADGTGGHAFAETLEEHNRNVAKWRRIQRQREE